MLCFYSVPEPTDSAAVAELSSKLWEATSASIATRAESRDRTTAALLCTPLAVESDPDSAVPTHQLKVKLRLIGQSAFPVPLPLISDPGYDGADDGCDAEEEDEENWADPAAVSKSRTGRPLKASGRAEDAMDGEDTEGFQPISYSALRPEITVSPCACALSSSSLHTLPSPPGAPVQFGCTGVG